ncbi:MAG: hypothetical protein AB7O96_06925 [Pseudobdellovibrionaceae bacterium]
MKVLISVLTLIFSQTVIAAELSQDDYYFEGVLVYIENPHMTKSMRLPIDSRSNRDKVCQMLGHESAHESFEEDVEEEDTVLINALGARKKMTGKAFASITCYRLSF